jgi:hypothetical protein
MSLADDVEARRPELRPAVEGVRERFRSPVVGLSDQEVYAPFRALLEALRVEGSGVAEADADADADAVRVSVGSAAAPEVAPVARPQGRRRRGSDDQLRFEF